MLDFHEARDGDHILIPFECDLCIFRKLRKVDPLVISSKDQLLLVCIRRMNLDAFWSRARSTVAQNTRNVKTSIKFSESLGLQGTFEHQGPYQDWDHCGYEVASNILLYSRNTGKHDTTHTQFETIRKLRSVFSNHCRAAPQSNVTNYSMVDGKGKYTKLVNDKCGSLWFQRFMSGCQNRMGAT